MNITTNRKNVWRILLSILMVIQSLVAFSQYTEVDAYSKEFPGENGVISFARDYIELKLDKEDVSILATYEKQSVFFNDNASLYAAQEIGYSSFFSIFDIEAYTMVPENGKYVRQNVNEFKNNSFKDENVFFDDNRSKSFYFPNLQKNALSCLKYKKSCEDPYLLPKVFLSSYLPVAKREVEVCYDQGIEVSYRLFNCDSLDISMTSYSKGKKNYLKWTANHIDKLSYDENAPDFLYQMPHMVLYIKSYEVKDTVVGVLDSEQRFFQWCYSFVKEAVEKDFPTVDHFTDSLTTNTTTSLDKIKLIYSWVQDNIRYVAFEEGYSGFKPRLPEMVLSRRYGDCKDMASLLSCMLRSQNIKAYVAWVGTRMLPYRISDAPIPGIFNHMVAVAYDDAGTEYILDPTASNLYLPFPSEHIQGKELMVCIDSGNYKIITAPVVAKEDNVVDCKMMVEITDGRTVSGTGTYTQTGYYGMIFREYYEGFKEDEKIKFVKNNIARGNNKLKIDQFAHSSLKSKEEPLVNTFSYTIPDYCHINGNEIYINLNIRKSMLNMTEMKDRTCDLENDFNYISTEKVILKIPEGYELKHLPADDRVEGPLYGFSSHYTVADGQVTLERSLYLNYLILDFIKLNDWNNFIKRLNVNCSETVVLGAKNASDE